MTRSLSYYATDALKSTLERLADFDGIKDGPIRLRVGAQLKLSELPVSRSYPLSGKVVHDYLA